MLAPLCFLSIPYALASTIRNFVRAYPSVGVHNSSGVKGESFDIPSNRCAEDYPTA